MNHLQTEARSLSKTPTLRANFSWMFLGNVIYAACQWGMLAAIAKLSTPETVGQFALAIAITSPIFMFTCLDLRQVQVTDALHEYAHGDYIALRLVSTGVGYVAVILLALILDYRAETKVVILLVGIAKAFETIGDLFYGILQEYERMDRIAKSLILKGLLSLAAMATILAITQSLIWAVGSMAFFWASLVFLYDIPNASQVVTDFKSSQQKMLETNPLSPCWDLKTMHRLVRVALPLGLMMLLVSLYTNVPRYFLERYWGEADLGVFAALSYIMVAGRTVTVALGQAIVARLANYFMNRRLLAYSKLLLKSVTIGLMMGIAGIIVALVMGKPVLELLYSPEYAQHVDVFVGIMVAAGIRYLEGLIGYGLTATRFFAVKLPLAILDTLSATGLCLWLIPSGGISGATGAMIGAALLKLLATSVVLLYILKRHSQNNGEAQSSKSEPVSSIP